MGSVYHRKHDIEGSASENERLLLVDAIPEVRGGFFTRVYALVATQLLLTFGWMGVVVLSPSMTEFVLTVPEARVIASITGLLCLCPLFAYKDRHPINLLLLLLFTCCQAYVIGALGAMYVQHARGLLVLYSLGLTTVLFAGLSLYVHITRRDMRGLEGPLAVGFVSLLGIGLFAAFFPPTPILNLALSAGGVIIFSGYVLYDTSMMIHTMTPDDAVVAAVQLYLDILNLFVCILQMLNGGRDN